MSEYGRDSVCWRSESLPDLSRVSEVHSSSGFQKMEGMEMSWWKRKENYRTYNTISNDLQRKKTQECDKPGCSGEALFVDKNGKSLCARHYSD